MIFYSKVWGLFPVYKRLQKTLFDRKCKNNRYIYNMKIVWINCTVLEIENYNFWQLFKNKCQWNYGQHIF